MRHDPTNLLRTDAGTAKFPRNPRGGRARNAAKGFPGHRRRSKEVADGFRKEGLGFEPTSTDYFTFTVQQVAFVRLCGGNPDTLEGGNPEIGQRIVNNGQHIIDTYWRYRENT